MLKSARHAKILDIISSKEIETQEELCAELNKENYVVTQATVSRDIRDLHLFKVTGNEKKYRYSYINEGKGELSDKMKTIFKNVVVGIHGAKNLVVVKTLSGNGSNAGSIVDKMDLEVVVGSVAGDDTLLIVCTDDESAQSVVEKLQELIR